MRAMILAAGYGTRLWPLTVDRTKPAIPFLGRPLVGYVAEYLARNGFDEIAVNLHHQPESVRAALGDGSRFGVRFTYTEEPVILGPSGALDNARWFLEGSAFVVINGKIITDIDLRAALEKHRRSDALATLVLLRNTGREKFTPVQTDAGLITGFGGSPDEFDQEPLMFTGIQILEPRIFDYIPRGVFSHTVTDVYLPAIAKGERLAAHVATGMWYELSTVQRYLDITLALLSQSGRDVDMGRGCVAEEGAEVREAILWDEVRVERGARVRRAVLGEGVRVPAGETIERAAVVRAELVRGIERPPKGLAGEVRGENFVAPLPE